MFPVSLLLLLWIVLPEEKWDETVGYIQPPNKEYIKHIPVSALLLFLAVPFLYTAANSFTVPKLESMDTLQDQYTRRPTTSQSTNLQFGRPPESTLPEICDLDPATLLWYPVTPS